MKRLILLLAAVSITACSSLIFQPSKGYIFDPEKVQKYFKIQIDDVYFTNKDGLKLHGWFLPNQTQKTKGTILFLHGNGDNISGHINMVWWLPRSGYNVFMPDYRGYGFSEGEPDLEGVHQDVTAAMEALFSRQDIDQKKLLLYGHSLGGAIAITSLADSAYRDRFKVLIVEGAFTRYRTAAQEALGKFWLTWLFQYPLSWTIRDDYAPIEAIPRISPIPVLLVHGDADPVIAHHHSGELYAAAREPKEFWLVSGASHGALNNLPQRERLLNYLDKMLK